MKTIVLLGDPKPLIASLVSTLMTAPSFEMLIHGGIHVVSDGVAFRCVYKEGPIDSRMIDYLHTASTILVCYHTEEGDQSCAYWIETVQQHVPATPIVVVGFHLSDGQVPESSLVKEYHITRLISNPMEDRIVKEYLCSKAEPQEETCCCLKYI